MKRSPSDPVHQMRLIGFLGLGLLIFSDSTTCEAKDLESMNSGYLVTSQPQDPQYLTAITRLTKCKISSESDFHKMPTVYPKESTKHHEEGRVIMRFTIDSDLCVRKAIIEKSSGYFRLDKASLAFAMQIKFQPGALENATTGEDGERILRFPLNWQILNPYVPGDRCSGSAMCIDEKPPALKAEVPGGAPDATSIWMPGYYVYEYRTGYQWCEGHWGLLQSGSHWIPPHWDRFRTKWVFVPGIWEKDH